MREVLGRYEAAGVDQVIFLAQAGRTKHEHICESLELFARDVMPEFVAREPAHLAGEEARVARGDRRGDVAQGATPRGRPVVHLLRRRQALTCRRS